MSRQTKRELIDRVFYEARASEAATKAFDEAAFEKLGLNNTDGRCLDILDNEGPLTAGRLAELSGLTTAAVTTVLDRLERSGYAHRVRDERDRRRVMVEVDPSFASRAERIWGPLGDEARERFERMSVAELEAVSEFFRLSRDLNERHVERVRGLELD